MEGYKQAAEQQGDMEGVDVIHPLGKRCHARHAQLLKLPFGPFPFGTLPFTSSTILQKVTRCPLCRAPRARTYTTTGEALEMTGLTVARRQRVQYGLPRDRLRLRTVICNVVD